MTVRIRNEKRLEILDLLPLNWGDKIEQHYLDQGYVACSVYPDQGTIYAGSDKAVIRVLKKHGLLTPELKSLLS